MISSETPYTELGYWLKRVGQYFYDECFQDGEFKDDKFLSSDMYAYLLCRHWWGLYKSQEDIRKTMDWDALHTVEGLYNCRHWQDNGLTQEQSKELTDGLEVMLADFFIPRVGDYIPPMEVEKWHNDILLLWVEAKILMGQIDDAFIYLDGFNEGDIIFRLADIMEALAQGGETERILRERISETNLPKRYLAIMRPYGLQIR